MKLPGDEIIRTYIDDEGNEVTVVKGYDGDTYHCWEMDVPNDVAHIIDEGAKKHGVEDWEFVNMVLQEAMDKYAEEDKKRKFIREISD